MSMKRDWEEVFFEALTTGNTSRAIVNQERRGQRDLNDFDVLPKKCPREQLEALGFVFGGEVDDLFIQAKLPAGWTKQAKDHAMWTDLLDGKGRARGSMFYKAAFYDRDAFLHLNRRYSYGVAPVTGYGDNYDPEANRIGVVKDREAIIWKSAVSVRHDDYQAQDCLNKDAKAWLAERFPNWEDVLAYWD